MSDNRRESESSAVAEAEVTAAERAAGRARRKRMWWYLLFLVQFAAIAWPPLYNKAEPSFAGIPFFYWYQLLWIVLGGVLTAIVYFATEASRRNPNKR